jgi:hypothetical protein
MRSIGWRPLQTGVAGLAIQLSLSLPVLAGNPESNVARAITILITSFLFYMIEYWSVLQEKPLDPSGVLSFVNSQPVSSVELAR